MEKSTTFKKERYDKIGNEPVQPGFWIGLIMILILLYLVQTCKGGGFG